MKPERERRETDAALRRSLEPDAATVDRMVRAALAGRTTRRRSRAPWRLAAAAAVLVLAVVFLPFLSPDAPPTPAPPAGDAGAAAPPVAARPVAARPVALSIYGDGSFVAVVTAAGSKMILLPEEKP